MKYLFLLTCVISLACHASVYEYVDKNGTVTYTDTPVDSRAKIIDVQPSGAEGTTGKSAPPQPSVEVPLIPTVKKVQTVTVTKDKTVPYTDFAILSPADQDTIQNQPVIPVEIKMEPTLRVGDKIQMFLDGKPFGPQQTTLKFDLPRMERGTHQLHAVLLDTDLKNIKISPGITIYIHQAHLGGTPGA